MEKDKLESLLIDYIDGNLNMIEQQMVEQELTLNPAARKLYQELKEVMEIIDKEGSIEPHPSMRDEFQSILTKEIQENRSSKSVFFSPVFYRIAAGVALLILGGSIGFLISKQNNKRLDEIAGKLKSHEEQLSITKEMMTKLANEQSASQRIQGVNVALKFEKADDEIVSALSKTMNEDPNTNVRLAALEALSKFIDEPEVRKALTSALQKQKDPHVQIALIRILVKIKEQGVVNDLQKIVDDESTIKAVKNEAYSGILRLS